jgi:DNA-binding NtrC family response regulator
MMHVVHIEDDKSLRMLMQTALELSHPGVRLQQFASADSALDYIAKNCNTIDLYILDVRIPGAMNGLQIAKKIRDIGCRGNMIITSAYSSPSQEVLTSLRCTFVPKSWHIMDIAQTLESYRVFNVPTV